MSKEIPLTNGLVAIVDEADYPSLSKFKWVAIRRGDRWYACRTEGIWPHKKLIRMHREIMQAPAEMEVDHIDWNGLNNTRANLRIVNSSTNHQNRRKMNGCTSKYLGVTRKKKDRGWTASIYVKGKYRYLGYFMSEEDAAAAYDTAARLFYGQDARVNGVK